MKTSSPDAASIPMPTILGSSQTCREHLSPSPSIDKDTSVKPVTCGAACEHDTAISSDGISSCSSGVEGSHAGFSSSAPEGEVRLMPPFASLGLVMYWGLLMGAQIMIILPTAEEYAEQLGAGEVFSGLMIGMTPLAATAGIVLLHWAMQHATIKSLLVILSLGMVCGNLIYAIAKVPQWLTFLLLGRTLSGLCLGVLLPLVYISRTVGMQRRSEIMFYMSAMLTMGYAAGPAFAMLVEVFVEKWCAPNPFIDSDSGPGWLMALLYILFILKVAIFMEDLPIEDNATASQIQDVTDKKERFPIAAAGACFWVILVAGAVMTSCEVYAVNIALHRWGWHVTMTAPYLCALMTCVALTSIFIGPTITRTLVNDRKGMLSGSAVGVLGGIILLDFGVESVAIQLTFLAVGQTILLVVAGMVRSFGLSLATKLTPLRLKRHMNMYACMALTLGRGMGALLGSMLSTASFAVCMMGLFALTCAVVFSCYTHLEPHRKAS